MPARPAEGALEASIQADDLEGRLAALDDHEAPAFVALDRGDELAAPVTGVGDDGADVGRSGERPATSLAPARRSDMPAGSTRLAIDEPDVPTRMWRLRPFARLCPSKPRTPPSPSSSPTAHP
jgi:hypothetical protein